MLFSLYKKTFKLQYSLLLMGSWFKTKKVTVTFAVLSLIAGFLFIDQNSTGNAVINSTRTGAFNSLSFIGLLLIFCSAILAFYSIRN